MIGPLLTKFRFLNKKGSPKKITYESATSMSREIIRAQLWIELKIRREKIQNQMG